jgi:ATPase subunit of ABC transporter with duplicated ATPase domains
MTVDSNPDLSAVDSGWPAAEEEGEPSLDDVDAGWDLEEERARAADVAIGLDAAARRKAAEERAALRKEKLRAKKLAALEKRKARSESARQKQKKPKKRVSMLPRAAAAEPLALAANSSRESKAPRSAQPGESKTPKASVATVRRRNSARVLLFLAAFAIATGALVFALRR